MITFLMTIEDEKTRSKLEKIYLEYHRDMYVTAYSILKNYHDAQDMVHEAVLKLSGNLHKILDIKCKKTRSFLVIVVRNLSLNAYNKRKGVVLLEHDDVKRLPNNDEFFIEENFIRMDSNAEIAKLLAQIHPPYADIITLRFYYELEIYEIARLLDTTENNVSVRIKRALTALKKILEEVGKDYEQTV